MIIARDLKRELTRDQSKINLRPRTCNYRRGYLCAYVYLTSSPLYLSFALSRWLLLLSQAWELCDSFSRSTRPYEARSSHGIHPPDVIIFKNIMNSTLQRPQPFLFRTRKFLVPSCRFLNYYRGLDRAITGRYSRAIARMSRS